MNQIVIDKMAREIMVVANEKLFSWVERTTKFYPNNEHNFEEAILENYEYMVRGEAEENTRFKQPITYWVVVNQDNKIFVYRRGWAGSNAWESRLHSMMSFGVGGHIEREDEDSENIMKDSLIREVEEEINISKDNISSLEAMWYLNDDSELIHEVHIWIVYLIRVNNDETELLDWELEKGDFVNIDDLQDMVDSPEYSLENWSMTLFEPLKNILQK